jgi:hypothetical protein
MIFTRETIKLHVKDRKERRNGHGAKEPTEDTEAADAALEP